MRLLALVLLLTTLSAQQPVPEPKPQATAAPQAPPAAAVESAWSGSIEIGARLGTGVAGDFNTYRSVVNLGEGIKLFGFDFALTDPKKRLFDRVDARGYNWGDDPYSSFSLNARKARRYRLDIDYRNIAYFNDLPSFANPLLDRGILQSQNAYDVRRRLSSLQLDLLPGSWLMPYLSFDRSAGEGRGVTNFVSTGNEYPVPSLLRDGANSYRGGIRLERQRAHLTIEQGGTTFRDDQQVYAAPGSNNSGNRTTPLLGQHLFLNSLLQSYGIRGSGIYTRGLFTANPVSWLDVYGQFLYSLPSDDTRYQQTSTGNFWGGGNQFFTAEQFLLGAQAKLPHTSGSFGAEVRPARRLRILTSWLTDRLHVSSSAQGQQIVAPPVPTPPPVVPQSGLLVSNYSQQQVDAILDVSTKLTLRGGYRYVWGDGGINFQPPTGLANSESARLARHVAIAGVTWRPAQKMYVNGEVEAASSDHTYFRTSLYNYQKARARFRYQVLASISLSADFRVLNNHNPNVGANYDYLSRQTSVSLLWTPAGSAKFSLHADYTRSTIRSDMPYLAPPFFVSEISLYRDNTHIASILADFIVPDARAIKLSLGGSLALTSGSRPTQYFQPLARVAVPVNKAVSWVSQWRYYGFGETFYGMEAFRTHLITTGLLITK